MSIDQLAQLFALVVAANLVLLIALQLPRLGRRRRSQPADYDGAPAADGARPNADDHDEVTLAAGRGEGRLIPTALYQRMTRVVSYVFIAAAMAIAVLTMPGDQTAVIILLAFGLIVIELFQDVLPSASLGRLRVPLEAAATLLFVTALLIMTGGVASPFFFGYILVVGAAALVSSGLSAAILAIISSLAYLVAVIVSSGSASLTSEDFGLVAFNLVSIALVMYVAAVIGREQRRAREEALRLARFDALTGLYSRRHLLAQLEQEIPRASRSGRPFGLALLDLDSLKYVNDRFGHEWGDNLLRAVGEVLRNDVRVSDVAARYGGDEFVLLLPDTDLAGTIRVAEKVRIDIGRIRLPHDGEIVRTTASVGVVSFPDDGRTANELLRRADTAMFEAKRRGRDQTVRFARDPGDESREAVASIPSRQAPDRVPPESPGPVPWEDGSA